MAVVMRLAAKNPPAPPFPPVRKGEPATGLRLPLGVAENAEMLFGVRSLFVYTKVVGPCAFATLNCVCQDATNNTTSRKRRVAVFIGYAPLVGMSLSCWWAIKLCRSDKFE